MPCKVGCRELFVTEGFVFASVVCVIADVVVIAATVDDDDDVFGLAVGGVDEDFTVINCSIDSDEASAAICVGSNFFNLTAE